MKKLTSITIVGAIIALAGSANAQTKSAFGERGTIAVQALTADPMLTGDINGYVLGATPLLGLNTTTYSGPEQNGRQDSIRATAFYINPRAHFFVIDHLSIGADLLIASVSAKSIVKNNGTTTETDAPAPNAIGVLPLIGYDIGINDKFSIWPQGGIGFRHGWYTQDNGRGNTTDITDSWWFFSADVQFMFHIAPHFSLGVGPGVTASLSQSRSAKNGSVTVSEDHSTTQWRWLSASMVGWF